MTNCIISVAVVALLMGAAHGLSVKCKCDCQGTDLTCGKDLKTNALQTFKNPCQMICQNCVSSEKWIPVKSGDCDKLARTRRRPPAPPPSALTAPVTTASAVSPKLTSTSKQSELPSQTSWYPSVRPSKRPSSPLAKEVPSPLKSPNTLPPPHHNQQQPQKVPAIGG